MFPAMCRDASTRTADPPLPRGEFPCPASGKLINSARFDRPGPARPAAPGDHPRSSHASDMKQISVGIIGTGWCGGIRAETCAANPVVKELHIAETRPERLAEVARACNPRSATADYRELLKVDGLDAVMISATPETTHYPMARESLLAGKHVFLEKPIAIELHEADDLIAIARRNGLKFT